MAILTDDMKRLVREQRLGYVATVCSDGTPNLSPKGTLTVRDDDQLMFADIHSPGTVANLRHNPSIEVNVVDPVSRKGYRFKGIATIFTEGAEFDRGVAFYRDRGTTNPIQSIVTIEVQRAQPLLSPAYDTGQTEQEIKRRWRAYYASLDQEEPDSAITQSRRITG